MSSFRKLEEVSRDASESQESAASSDFASTSGAQPGRGVCVAEATRQEAESTARPVREDFSRAVNFAQLREYTERISRQSQQVQETARRLMQTSQAQTASEQTIADREASHSTADMLSWTAKLDEAVAQINSVMEELQKLATRPEEDSNEPTAEE